jgi:phosphoserine phosphatase RsbU/P
MIGWLRNRTLFQKVALLLALLSVGGVFAAPGLTLLAIALFVLAFRKELLWRVRNRLFVTYLLFGAVPVLLIGLALVLAGELLLGQFATQRVRRELEARIESVHSTAQELTLAASHNAKSDLLLDGIRQRVPNLSVVIRSGGDVVQLDPNAEFQAAPSWLAAGFQGIFEANGRDFIAANVRQENVETFAYVPLDQHTLASLTPGVVSVPEVLRGNIATTFQFSPLGNRLFVGGGSVRREIVPSGLGPRRGWWDLPIASLLPWTVQSSNGSETVYLPLLSRPYPLLAGISTGRMAEIALSMLFVVCVFYLFIEVVALFFTVGLTRAITRSVDDLYRGTLQVAQGDFSHQIPVRGKHQLSELASSFNTMTAKIDHLIGEVKKKEKLEAELEVARDVQWGLFPKSAPKLKTLEMTAICIPGRVVSGDYYDYVGLDERWTVVALGDVSGKGVSAALLMASIQSALHAQLRFGRVSSSGEFGTAALMEQIGQQLYENTPPEKYATFFCSAYDDEAGRLTYTNAGHLQPILVRDGKPISLEGSGMVAGLIPDVKYEQQDVQLKKGDLVAIFSDGISEAMDAAQQEFGAARLAELLVVQRDKPLDEILSAVTSTVTKWIHDPEGRDDLTLMLLRKL